MTHEEATAWLGDTDDALEVLDLAIGEGRQANEVEFWENFPAVEEGIKVLGEAVAKVGED